RDGALAAPALADERRDRAGAERERDVVDGVHLAPAPEQAAVHREVLRERADLELRDGHRCASTRWHATSCAGATSRSTGRTDVWRAYSSASSGRQCGQRGLNRQPGGGSARSGGAPGIPVSRSTGPVSGGNERVRPNV